MLGARYYIVDDHRDPVTSHLNSLAKEAGYPVVALLPQGPHHNAGEAALWNVYELRHPNVGDYSPTEVMTAVSGAAASELMTKPEFDFTRQAVLSAPPERTLVPARN